VLQLLALKAEALTICFHAGGSFYSFTISDPATKPWVESILMACEGGWLQALSKQVTAIQGAAKRGMFNSLFSFSVVFWAWV
jgi:hypothetical protein